MKKVAIVVREAYAARAYERIVNLLEGHDYKFAHTAFKDFNYFSICVMILEASDADIDMVSTYLRADLSTFAVCILPFAEAEVLIEDLKTQ